MAEIVRRRSWGGVLPLGRHVSISGSRSIHAPSVSIAPSSFQEEQNARHHKQFKLEQALASRRRQSQPTKPKPSWFEGRGESHHLSQQGVKHLRSLFDQGLSQSEAAQRMGITPAAVRRRFREWGGKQAA